MKDFLSNLLLVLAMVFVLLVVSGNFRLLLDNGQAKPCRCDEIADKVDVLWEYMSFDDGDVADILERVRQKKSEKTEKTDIKEKDKEVDA